ncbi:MAG: hypothetical protein EOS22_04770 [Mesorhizobium sp.]|uniref:hypothetical protein n=1 Tax=Mesorhizobium sp. TaxID=1871066 RepID=UPI000FE6B62B|nr:hypothetical protein [Mesorhizobium sp.]RWD31337.1 MAG: hypothetical protein EOS22_04770 [Mesorhizobium sp.]TJW70749.1 MAG: hypothetical protein E5V29_03295 [Mesorhizobium sp.]
MEPTSIKIVDPETIKLIHQIRDEDDIGITEAVRRSAKAYLAQKGRVPVTETNLPQAAPDLLAKLADRLRSANKTYVELLTADDGQRHSQGRVPQMLKVRGPIETALRFVRSEESRGFQFLKSKDRLDVAFESIILEPEFEHLFDENTKSVARLRLGREGRRI